MNDFPAVLTSIVLLCAAAFLLEYRGQRQPGLPPWNRSLRRLRMFGWSLCGFALLWFALAQLGLTRGGELQEVPGLQIGWLPLLGPRAVEIPPPEAELFAYAGAVGFWLVVGTGLLQALGAPRGSKGENGSGRRTASERASSEGSPPTGGGSIGAGA